MIMVFVLTCLPAYTAQVRQVSWKDLIPAHLISEDPLAKLAPDLQNIAYWVINILETLPKRGPDNEELYKQVEKTIPDLKKAGIDIVKIMEKRIEIQTSMVEELNGKRVRMSGYLLPLEMSDAKVTEFLLVPYVGACIHVPPPPPNQIVHVKLDSGKGYQSKGLYEPVRVTGLISIKSMVKDLFFVDGTAGINIGYTMKAEHVDTFKK